MTPHPPTIIANRLRRSKWMRRRVNKLRLSRAVAYERSIGINTTRNPIEHDHQRSRSYCPDATWYDVMDYTALHRYLRPLKLTAHDTVVDVGCGMGRIICLCGMMPIARCIGVEIDPQLACIARTNAALLSGRRTPIDIVCDDAAQFDYDQASVIVLFNPFGAETCKAMLHSIYASLGRRPRQIRIGYFNPVCADVLHEQTWLRHVCDRQSPSHHYGASYWDNNVC